MPLRIAESPLLDHDSDFLIFYASIVDGKMWCPDCRAVDDLVQQTFAAPDAPSATIIYVGNKPQWKAPDNVFRGEPFNVTAIPTIVKLKESVEVGRLVEDPQEIKSKLATFATVDSKKTDV